MYSYQKHRQFNADEQIPFLCPPKYHYKYYKPLLNDNLKQYPLFIIVNILDYVCGELDYCQDKDFFASHAAKTIIRALDDEQQHPSVQLCEHDPNKWHMDANTIMDKRNMDANTNTMKWNECKEIINKFILKDKQNNDFESIWYWQSYGSVMNMGDYGEYESFYTVIGQLKYKSLQNKNVYCKIHFTDYEEDFCPHSYSLSFTFSDSLEAFWIDGVNWRYFRQQFVKLFDPDPTRKLEKWKKHNKHKIDISLPTLQEIQQNQQKQADIIKQHMQQSKTKSENCVIL